jgi:hypothetical protein
MAQKEQNFKNHARLDPSFHIFLTLGALLLLVASIVQVVRDFSWWGILRVFGVVWLIVLQFKVRLYALKVRDRVIRLEERLRMAQLLPEPLKARIPEFTEAQLIALRFASDAELPELAQRTLDEKLEPKAIKQAVKNWRPDYWRV